MSIDTTTAQRLCDLLLRQYAAHQELLTALTEQQQAVRRFDADALEQSRERCDELAQRIARLDEAREAMIGRETTISAIAAGLPEPTGARLTALAAKLRQLAERIAGVNRVNAGAIRGMIANVHAVYKLMADGGRQGGYTAAGKTDAAHAGAFMIDAVA